MISGVINIKKEAGFTSHDVVAKMRGILRQKKIGHTGTLDPDATGVLPVCLGRATKLCDIISEWDKTYEAVLLLGKTTDTEDTSGNVLTESEVHVSEEKITEILHSFLGEYDQIPPMYSAKKVKGKKLYELAREGIVIERKPCRVNISSIEIRKIDLPRVVFSVTCSKGTYIRSLCRDVGEKAGCGGCMDGLTRTRVADFHLEDAITLSELEQLRDQERVPEVLRSVDSLFSDYPAVTIQGEANKWLLNGNPIAVKIIIQKGNMSQETSSAFPIKIEDQEFLLPDGGKLRMYDKEKHFIGLYELNVTKKRLQPYKLFFDFEMS